MKNNEKEPKLILKKEKEIVATKPIFIDVNILNTLKEIKAETNIPMNKLAQEFILFGIQHMEIQDSED
ncbi:MAG: hypothetical protein PWP69_893 [Enterococcus sp.]|uniref:hypothetical protein n=1 Tax=Enterococcus sp. TaxID=35783 RepID=UPI0025864A5E|nr:hypothetical protein [Enterococcus sp.]MDK2844101.1 hypothetical protein [Enterococcus sp.]